jgi:hypothetical protein
MAQESCSPYSEWRERERERETDKGARDKLPFQDMPPVTYSLCQIPPPKVSATSQLSIKL